MKKIILICIILLFSQLKALAYTVKALALKDFSTKSPQKQFSAQVIETKKLSDGKYIRPGTIISGIVIGVEHPKIGKRNASFEYAIQKIQYKNKLRTFKTPTLLAKVTPYDPTRNKSLVFKAGKTTAGFFVTGLSQGISFVQGFFDGGPNGRIKEGARKIYEDSPISYVQKGVELKLLRGEPILLKLEELK